MKKLVLFLALSLSTSAFTQLAPPTPKVNLHLSNSKNILDNSRDIRVGPVMMLGGASFIAAGMLTTPFYVGGSTTQKKPFFQQGPRMLAILSGAGVMVVGVGFSLGGR
jgi:hypothetical protein